MRYPVMHCAVGLRYYAHDELRVDVTAVVVYYPQAQYDIQHRIEAMFYYGVKLQ